MLPLSGRDKVSVMHNNVKKAKYTIFAKFCILNSISKQSPNYTTRLFTEEMFHSQKNKIQNLRQQKWFFADSAQLFILANAHPRVAFH